MNQSFNSGLSWSINSGEEWSMALAFPLKKGINHISGELTNESTGEIFKIHIQYRGDFVDGFVIEQTNFKGNMGSHYNERLV